MNYTEEDVRDHFEGLGLSDRYYNTYKGFVINRVQEENRYGSDLSIENILEDGDKYIECYSSQIELGHSHEWADAYAEEASFDEGPERCAMSAYNTLSSFNRDEELRIHASTISSEPVFFDIYKSLVEKGDSDAKDHALELLDTYNDKLDSESEAYARDYVHYLASEGSDEYFADLHAKSYSIAIENGYNQHQAFDFAEEVTDSIDQGSLMNLDDKYKNGWQGDYITQLMREHFD